MKWDKKDIAFVIKEYNKNCSEVIVGMCGAKFCGLFRFFTPQTNDTEIYKECMAELSERGYFKMGQERFFRKYGYVGYYPYSIKKSGLYRV